MNGHTTNFTVINLREGKSHYFAVHAVNKNGKSISADTMRPVVPRRVISKYTSHANLKIIRQSFLSPWDHRQMTHSNTNLNARNNVLRITVYLIDEI